MGACWLVVTSVRIFQRFNSLFQFSKLVPCQIDGEALHDDDPCMEDACDKDSGITNEIFSATM